MNLWIVGKVTGETVDGIVWEFFGVYDEKEVAESICTSPYHFVGPTSLNETMREETFIWDGCYYPKRDDQCV